MHGVLAPDALPELALEVGLLLPLPPHVGLPDLVLLDSAKQLASSTSPLLALEDGLLVESTPELGLLEPALEREFGLLELALEVGRLPPSLPSENGEDELEPKCCWRCGMRDIQANLKESIDRWNTQESL